MTFIQLEGPDLIQTSSKKSHVLFCIRTKKTKPRDINQVTVHNTEIHSTTKLSKTVSVNEFRYTTESISNFGEINIRFSTKNKNYIPYKKQKHQNDIKSRSKICCSNFLIFFCFFLIKFFNFFLAFIANKNPLRSTLTCWSNPLITSTKSEKNKNINDSSAFIHHLHNNVNNIQWYIKQDKINDQYIETNSNNNPKPF